MTNDFFFEVLVGSYVSTEDAKSDLEGLDGFYFDRQFSAYDAVLVITDAWSQVRVESHKSRTPADLDVGPIHQAFTGLFGGPFIAGEAPPRPGDRRVTHKDLLAIGDAMGPSSVKMAVLAVGEGHPNLEEVLPRAGSVGLTSVQSSAEGLAHLASSVADVIRSRKQESSQRPAAS